MNADQRLPIELKSKQVKGSIQNASLNKRACLDARSANRSLSESISLTPSGRSNCWAFFTRIASARNLGVFDAIYKVLHAFQAIHASELSFTNSPLRNKK